MLFCGFPHKKRKSYRFENYSFNINTNTESHNNPAKRRNVAELCLRKRPGCWCLPGWWQWKSRGRSWACQKHRWEGLHSAICLSASLICRCPETLPRPLSPLWLLQKCNFHKRREKQCDDIQFWPQFQNILCVLFLIGPTRPVWLVKLINTLNSAWR